MVVADVIVALKARLLATTHHVVRLYFILISWVPFGVLYRTILCVVLHLLSILNNIPYLIREYITYSVLDIAGL